MITEGRRFLLAVLLMAVSWGLGVVQYTTLLLAFFPDGKLLWAAFSLGVGALGIAAPSSPGAVGVLELALVGALAVFGLDPSTALAFALTVHLLQYVITGVLGAIALARDGETLAGMYRQVRHLPEKEQA